MRGQGRADDHVQQDSQLVIHSRSSMPSTGVGASGDAPMDRYPVNNIREKIPCELHVLVMNLSFKAADGYALSCESTTLWHCNEIPDGTVVSAWMKLWRDMTHWSLTSLELKMRRY